MARENYRKLAVDKALEYSKTCTAKQLSVEELEKVINLIYNFYTKKAKNGKQQF